MNWTTEAAAILVSVGATPAPPHPIRFPAAPAELEAHVLAEEKYGMPPEVPATVRAKVPLFVTGDPPTEINPPVKLPPTLVTVPLPAAAQAPSARRNVPLLQVPVHSPITSAELVEIVPLVVIVPPLRPAPAVMLVTVPLPPDPFAAAVILPSAATVMFALV